MSGVRRVGAAERVAGDPTPGMLREQAFSTGRVWCGIVTMSPGTTSGWHHHGDHATVAYVLSGVRRLETGSVLDAASGDFVSVPPGVVHRESNPTEEDAHAVAFRAGTGPVTVNVDGPEASGGLVSRIGPADRVAGDPTSGMVREPAVDTDGLWAGFVRTAPGSVSGWHHHTNNETAIYLVRGAMRIETASEVPPVDLEPGDFCFVPPVVVHRESNLGTEESHAVVFRAGSGPPTMNVEGPEGSNT